MISVFDLQSIANDCSLLQPSLESKTNSVFKQWFAIIPQVASHRAHLRSNSSVSQDGTAGIFIEPQVYEFCYKQQAIAIDRKSKGLLIK